MTKFLNKFFSNYMDELPSRFELFRLNSCVCLLGVFLLTAQNIREGKFKDCIYKIFTAYITMILIATLLLPIPLTKQFWITEHTVMHFRIKDEVKKTQK